MDVTVFDPDVPWPDPIDTIASSIWEAQAVVHHRGDSSVWVRRELQLATSIGCPVLTLEPEQSIYVVLTRLRLASVRRSAGRLARATRHYLINDVQTVVTLGLMVVSAVAVVASVIWLGWAAMWLGTLLATFLFVSAMFVCRHEDPDWTVVAEADEAEDFLQRVHGSIGPLLPGAQSRFYAEQRSIADAEEYVNMAVGPGQYGELILYCLVCAAFFFVVTGCSFAVSLAAWALG